MPASVPPKLHGRFTLDAASDGFTIDQDGAPPARVILLSLGGYFIRGYTGEPLPTDRTGGSPGAAGALGQLVEEIQARVRAAGAEFAAFVCTVSDTGFVTMQDDGGNFTVTWTDPALRDILGATGATSVSVPATKGVTFPNQHRYGWYPNVAPSDFDGDPDLSGVRSSEARATRAPAGQVTSTSYFEHIDRSFQFAALDDDYVFPTGTPLILNRDLETFWRDALRRGVRFRYYRERNVQTAPGGGAPWEYVAAERTQRNLFADDVTRTAPTWARLYNASMRFHLYVA